MKRTWSKVQHLWKTYFKIQKPITPIFKPQPLSFSDTIIDPMNVEDNNNHDLIIGKKKRRLHDLSAAKNIIPLSNNNHVPIYHRSPKPYHHP